MNYERLTIKAQEALNAALKDEFVSAEHILIAITAKDNISPIPPCLIRAKVLW